MLTRSFIHLQGVGRTTEARLWQRGARDWDAFLQIRDELGMAPGKVAYWGDCIEECQARLAGEDSRYFARTLAPRDQWRAYPEFQHRILYLDIETTGLDPERDRAAGPAAPVSMRASATCSSSPDTCSASG